MGSVSFGARRRRLVSRLRISGSGSQQKTPGNPGSALSHRWPDQGSTWICSICEPENSITAFSTVARRHECGNEAGSEIGAVWRTSMPCAYTNESP